jgi:oxygen-independent coproporphyrinogen-3 oxidase
MELYPVAYEAAEALGLYVHLPWCARKCPYCDFNSYEQRSAVPEADYVAALLRDLEFESATIGARPITSVYVGGGTPSLFSAPQVARLIEGIRNTTALAESAEITLEANPGTLEAARFADYRAVGVNRLSIGVQSLRDDQLARLGRVHSALDACNAVAGAINAGFDSVNIDLMYALPGDKSSDGLRDVENAIALGAPHLSWYQLTLEPNTAWARRPPPGIPDDEIVDVLERKGSAMLVAAGFTRYEVSAWAQPGHECLHNIGYWRFGDYIGIGAGAHSKLRFTDEPGHQRHSKRRNPLSFMCHAGTTQCIETREALRDERGIILEYLMNALRLTQGTSIAELVSATGIAPEAVGTALREARSAGLLVDCESAVRATDSGYRRLNELLRMLC